MPRPTDKPMPDWERIEAQYRAGALSIREAARADGDFTNAPIRKASIKEGWARDQRERIQARAEALVAATLARVQAATGSGAPALAERAG